MSDTKKSFSELSGSAVEIEAFGVPGTLGRLAAPLSKPATLHVATQAFWIPNPPRDEDLHVGFVADFCLVRDGEVCLRVMAPAAFRLMVDDDELAWGPLRFATSMPEYQECRVKLAAGTHRATLHVMHEGLTTRLAAKMPGFVWADIAGEIEEPPVWFGRHLHEYLATGLRVSPLQGWMEWTGSARAGQWRTEDPARILDDVVAGVPAGTELQVEQDRAAAIAGAIAKAGADDLVLIAGKGHEDYQILGTTRIHFDDREEAEKALRARLR